MNPTASPPMTAAPHDLFPYFRTVAEMPRPVDWTAFFGNDRPVELDVGCGRGMFLVNAGATHPDRNFLGIELDYKEGRRVAKRLQKRGWDHVRVSGGDAQEFLRHHVTPQSVDVAHVYFPDPWWKRKHKKRRLFNEEFADLLAKVVKAQGLVHSWTDVEDYFQVIAALMNHHSDFEPLPCAPLADPAHDLDYQTSFHRRRAQAGCTIYRGMWRRREISPRLARNGEKPLAPAPL
ncbi:MAG: tRNA (guanosine(46)-N7)-methyltransferase TrmB [Planctomycetaceae bacterium]